MTERLQTEQAKLVLYFRPLLKASGVKGGLNSCEIGFFSEVDSLSGG